MDECRPKIMPGNNATRGCTAVGPFTFADGHTVPVYDCKDPNALNQLIGYAKFINSDYGNVYYRGVDNLYPTLIPSLLRDRTYSDANDLDKVLNRICCDERLHKTLKLLPHSFGNTVEEKQARKRNRHIVEAVLQHYCGKSRYIDVVDNHWVAIWMGLQDFIKCGKNDKHCNCRRRQLTPIDIAERINSGEQLPNLYVYLLLMAMPHTGDRNPGGVCFSANHIEVDLRKTIPSFFLRPHAQHALAIRKRGDDNSQCSVGFYDLAPQTVGIMRIRIDRANAWIGDGTLLSAENLFPSPSLDQGYNTLLMRNDIFTYPFEIIKYF